MKLVSLLSSLVLLGAAYAEDNVTSTTDDVAGDIDIGAILAACPGETLALTACSLGLEIDACAECFLAKASGVSADTDCISGNALLCESIEECSESCGGGGCGNSIFDMVSCSIKALAPDLVDCELADCAGTGEVGGGGTGNETKDDDHSDHDHEDGDHDHGDDTGGTGSEQESSTSSATRLAYMFAAFVAAGFAFGF